MGAASYGEQIVAVMAGELNAPVNAPPFATWRSRVQAFGQSELPVGVLYSTKETIERVGPGVRLRRRRVRLEVLGSGDAPMDQALDQFYLYAIGTLYRSERLGGMTDIFTEDGIEWDVRPGAEDAAILAVEFEITYRTPADDPTTRYLP